MRNLRPTKYTKEEKAHYLKCWYKIIERGSSRLEAALLANGPHYNSLLRWEMESYSDNSSSEPNPTADNPIINVSNSINSKDHKVMANNVNHKNLPLLVTALLETFEPLTNALDAEMTDEARLTPRNEALDIGIDFPSSKDNGMKFLINGICQSIWRQTHGTIRSKDGKVFDNVKQRLESSEKMRAKVIENIEKGIIDDRDLTTIHWYRVNEARYEAHEQLLVAFATLYEHIFNEQWKPYNNEAEATNQADARKVLTEAEKEQYLKALGLPYTRKEPESVLIKATDPAAPKVTIARPF